jgi:hypothetical protein
MAAKVIGIILLIAGVVFLLFGFAYINSPQYKMMGVVNGFTGGADPTGNVAIGIGAVGSIIGFILLLVGFSSSKTSSPSDNPRPTVPKPAEPPIVVSRPEPLTEKAVPIITKEPTRVSRDQARLGSDLSPHLIYAGAGAVAVLILGIIWIAMSNSRANDSTTANSPQSVANVAAVNVKASTPQPTTLRQEVTVPSTQMWYDTGIDVPAGAPLRVEYRSGQWTNQVGSNMVDGQGKGGFERRDLLIVPSSQLSALVGKVGSNSFHIGNLYSGTPGSGRLYLSMNDTYDNPRNYDDNGGSLRVMVEVNGGSYNVPASSTGNVPTVKQMQDDIEKEVKKMVDEANR